MYFIYSHFNTTKVKMPESEVQFLVSTLSCEEQNNVNLYECQTWTTQKTNNFSQWLYGVAVLPLIGASLSNIRLTNSGKRLSNTVLP